MWHYIRDPLSAPLFMAITDCVCRCLHVIPIVFAPFCINNCAQFATQLVFVDKCMRRHRYCVSCCLCALLTVCVLFCAWWRAQAKRKMYLSCSLGFNGILLNMMIRFLLTRTSKFLYFEPCLNSNCMQLGSTLYLMLNIP